jgi:parallel beta-helix repeat protein
VSDNLATGNALSGIYLVAAGGCAVTGNNSYKNGAAGIEMAASSAVEGATCTGNVCANNGQDSSSWRRAGIVLRGAISGSVVAHNHCYDDQSTKTQQQGLLVYDAGPKDALIGPNIYDGNAKTGQSIDSGATKNVHSVPFKRLTVTVGNAQTSVAHGLSYVPQSIAITMTSPGAIYKSAAADATNVYLRADGQNRTAEVLVG